MLPVTFKLLIIPVIWVHMERSPRSNCWKSLKFAGASGILPLFIKTFFAENGYITFVTDLTHIWAEQLDRKQIIRRSLDENTSIDPTEDHEQFRKLLEVVETGLSCSEGSELCLYRIKDQAAGLILHVTVKLAQPLKALAWPLRLHLLPQERLKDHVLFPLIKSVLLNDRKIRTLQAILDEKDKTIKRLIGRSYPSAADRFSNNGQDRIQESDLEKEPVIKCAYNMGDITQTSELIEKDIVSAFAEVSYLLPNTVDYGNSHDKSTSQNGFLWIAKLPLISENSLKPDGTNVITVSKLMKQVTA